MFKGDFLCLVWFLKIKMIVLRGTTHKIMKMIVGIKGMKKFIVLEF
jgi:hypothetical protein